MVAELTHIQQAVCFIQNNPLQVLAHKGFGRLQMIQQPAA
jgi:hypothetical protein